MLLEQVDRMLSSRPGMNISETSRNTPADKCNEASQVDIYTLQQQQTSVSFCFFFLFYILNLWILHAYCNVFITVVQPRIPIQTLSSSLDVFHVKLSQKKYCWKLKSQVVRKRTEALHYNATAKRILH